MKRLDISTGELLEAMIAGKLEDWNKLDFKMYLEENGLDNRESLRLLLEEIEKKIEETRDGVFIPEHERESLAILRKRLEGKPVAPEYVKHVEELEEEERIMEQSGKKSLYRAMEERGFFNDAHEIAVSTALQDGNMKLLKRYWEEAVLGKVLEFRDHVKGMLGDEEKPDNGDMKEGTGTNLLECELSNRQMALICYYRKTPIYTKLKVSEIYKEFGSSNERTEKFQSHYSRIKFFANRTGADGTTANSCNIKDFEIVIEYFNKNQGKVPDELLADFELLKENVEKYRCNK
ncbi:hypothetical protein [Butyricimonas virosa]|jgi:hypothetical protein|nr:hypothetical protein [Butyricimonas virosa]RGL81547.1 hypothetical protein DXC42_18105 [Butyricimonas virosa]